MDPELREELLPVIVPVMVYWITCGIYHLFINSNENYRLYTKEEEETQNLATPKQVLVGVLKNHVTQIFVSAFQFMYLRKVVGIGVSSEPESLLRKVWQLAAAILIMDAWEYFVHKWLHESQFLYKHVHSMHHSMLVPYCYGGQSVHLVEAFVGQHLGSLVTLAVCDMGPRTAAVFFSAMAIKTVDDHCSRWFPGCNPFHRFLGNNVAFHAVHHQVQGFKYNYSAHFLTTWDLVLGTYLPYTLTERKGGGYEIRTAKENQI